MSTLKTKKVQLGDNADPSKNFLIEVPAVADGTLSIKRADGTNVLSIDAAGKAVIPGVVGTVAQVGGVPTGQVVERGSNSNGWYVRLADGTQICHQLVISASDTVTATGNVFRTGSNTWAYPAAFSSEPAVSGRSDGSPGYSWLALGASVSSNTSTSFSVFSPVSSANAPQVHLTAIGRWF